jgi:uncharacterized protein YukE
MGPWPSRKPPLPRSPEAALLEEIETRKRVLAKLQEERDKLDRRWGGGGRWE